MPGNIEVFKRLKQQIRIPLAAGERDRTIWEYDALSRRTVASTSCSPIAATPAASRQMRKIATLAETYHVPMAPHCTASYLGIAASLHVGRRSRSFSSTSSTRTITASTQRASPHGLEAGQRRLHRPAARPGLGRRGGREEAGRRTPKKPQTYKWPGAKLKDGSISDL